MSFSSDCWQDKFVFFLQYGRQTMSRISRRTIVLAGVGAITGCANSLDPSSQQATNDVIASGRTFSGSDSVVEFRVEKVLVASDGWVEYVINGRNKSTQPIGGIRGFIIDESGNEYEAATQYRDILKPPSATKDMLVTTGAGVATMLVAVPFLGPLVMLGLGATKMGQVDSEMALSKRFARSLQGAAVPGRETGTGSFFLPAIRPKGLKVGYVLSGTRRFVTVNG
ncbi:MAG: hypothetical protein ACK4NM_10180 [Hydrogenophaga sp.]